MITVYNDAKRTTLSAWSWPSRQVAAEMASNYVKHELTNINLQYLNPSHHAELLNTIVQSDIMNLRNRLRNALAISLRFDSSTDRTQNHNVYLMANIIFRDTSISTIFLGFLTPLDGNSDATTYFQLIKKIVKRYLPWDELFQLTTSVVSDGASVNTGKYEGLWIQMKKERRASNNSNLPLFSIWCIAHRVNLVWKAVCENHCLVKNLIQDMSNLSSYFHQSGERTQKLKHISSENNITNILKYPTYFAVRWTEFTFDLLNAVLRNWRGSIVYFTSENKQCY